MTELSGHLIIKLSTTRVNFVFSPGRKLTSLLSWHCYKTLIAATIIGKLLNNEDKSYTRLWLSRITQIDLLFFFPHSLSICYV